MSESDEHKKVLLNKANVCHKHNTASCGCNTNLLKTICILLISFNKKKNNLYLKLLFFPPTVVLLVQ